MDDETLRKKELEFARDGLDPRPAMTLQGWRPECIIFRYWRHRVPKSESIFIDDDHDEACTLEIIIAVLKEWTPFTAQVGDRIITLEQAEKRYKELRDRLYP